MKLIIAGPRDLYVDNDFLTEAVFQAGFHMDLHPISEIVYGACPTGVDYCVEMWTIATGARRQPFPAPWTRWRELGLKSRYEAGPYRNRKMAEYADALLVIKRKGVETRGTSSMMREAERAGIPIYVKEI